MTHVRAAAAALAAATIALLVPAPAHAAGPITFTSEYCQVYAIGMPGASGRPQFFCEYYWTGGTDPYMASASGNPARFLNITTVQVYSGHAEVFGDCTLARNFTVTLALTDSVGATGSDTADLSCTKPS